MTKINDKTATTDEITAAFLELTQLDIIWYNVREFSDNAQLVQKELTALIDRKQIYNTIFGEM